MQVHGLPPHGTYYKYAYEQENQQTNDNELELDIENECAWIIETERV